MRCANCGASPAPNGPSVDDNYYCNDCDRTESNWPP